MEIYNIKKDNDICKEVLAEILKISSKDASFLLGLCGGRSIAQMLKLLSNLELPGNIVALAIDERSLPLSDPESNYHLLHSEIEKDENLRKSIDLIPFDIAEEDDSLNIYKSTLEKHSGVFDLVFLGIGEDGHIASIFPNLEISHSTSQDYFIFEGSPKPPSRRITASHKVIAHAKNSILLIFGEGKRAAFNNLMNPNLSALECPAKYVFESGRAIIFTDLDC